MAVQGAAQLQKPQLVWPGARPPHLKTQSCLCTCISHSCEHVLQRSCSTAWPAQKCMTLLLCLCTLEFLADVSVSSRRGRAGGAVLPPNGPPTLLHPCLHEGYNRTYRRLSSAKSGQQPSPQDLLLLGRCLATVCLCSFSSWAQAIVLQPNCAHAVVCRFASGKTQDHVAPFGLLRRKTIICSVTRQAGLGGVLSAGGCGGQCQLCHKVPAARVRPRRPAAGHRGRHLLRPDGCDCG